MDSGLADLLSQYSYAIIVPLLYFIGPLVTMLAGMFIRAGELGFALTYAIIVTAFLVGDIAWYWIGYTYGEKFVKRYGHIFSITPELVAKVRNIFHRHHDKILFISKVTNGLGFGIAVLFTAGLSKVPFWRYFLFNLAGELVWSGSMLAAGYYLGHLYLEIDALFARLSIIGLVIMLFLALLGLGRYVRSKVLKL